MHLVVLTKIHLFIMSKTMNRLVNLRGLRGLCFGGNPQREIIGKKAK